ncbi:hypothetical protein M5689_019732 [Euphorbia peplus]|nr:hypothetical protein M5689_019732 [Euphorbia peplus]
MPPSPALRYSPSREHRAENHKRGRSFEGTLLLREKDDDLALFNEMQSKERETFLLESSEDLEDTFSTKLRQFSDFKLGISIPVRGESSELLNLEADKNDYDWLLTPPDTPLFPSLDDDEPQPVNVSSRGRPRSQPITISRSSTMEKSHRSSRGSASPNRLSPSPRSGNSSLQSRGRPSSAPFSSPTHSQRPVTPSRRPSPPPVKASTSAPRSLTPTSGRTSTGSGTRGISPVRTNRGNSASPKIRAWQSNIPGFSSEAPPNLRTSLTDRPATYVRGSSPASRNGRESSYRYGRQSMSPTASRSVSSSHSQDRDRISSNSRGSVASSGDDDVDSLQSIHVGSLDRLAPKRTGIISSNRAPALSKKPARIMSPSSAPKRSFDSALRQMDHRKSPQNMFRPLLSSVPSSTFYIGKATSVQRPLMSRNSSVTTSSNASSDIVAHDTEGSDHHQEDTALESGKTMYMDVQEDTFAFDKVDTLNNVEHDMDDGLVQFQVDDVGRNHTIECEPNVSEEFSYPGADFSEVNSHENTHVCSKCGCRYGAIEMDEKDINLCLDCRRRGSLMAVADSQSHVSDEHGPFDKPPVALADSQSRVSDNTVAGITQGDNVKLSKTSCLEHSHTFSHRSSLTRELMVEDEQRITGQPAGSHRRSGSDSGGQKLVHSNDFRSLKMDISEGAGISVLLKRSNSTAGPVVQSRTFVASSITYDDFCYTRDNANSLRSSIGHGSMSASSSIDLSSSRQVESRVQRQLSGKKSDMENYRYDTSARPQSTGSSFSGTSNHNLHAIGLATSLHEENMGTFAGIERASVTSHAENNEMSVSNASFTDPSPVQNSREESESNRTVDASTSDLSCNQLEENSVASFPNSEQYRSHKNEADVSNNTSSVSVVEAPLLPPDASAGTENSLASISEIETENYCQNTMNSENGDVSLNSKSSIHEITDSSVPAQSDKIVCYVKDCNDSGHIHLEDSTVMLEEGSKSRSLTLEEATDTILFCSSIVHDLAYQAATISIEKEDSGPLEGSWPTVTILGKSSADRKDSRNRTPLKRASNSHKVKQKRMEVDVKSPARNTENDENANESMVRNVGLPNNMDSTKPPKLESKCNCTIM